MRSITRRYWRKPDPFVIDDSTRSLAEYFNVLPELIFLLAKRGITGRKEIEEFLYPSLKDITDPFLMKDMESACKLVYQAIAAGEEIIIWGDYDVDGVTATALLIRFLENFTSKIQWFIPNRFIHGYGLDKAEIKALVEKVESGDPLLITVDCGITSYDEVVYAKELGCKIIITDHHEPGDQEVLADAILNIKQESCDFPDKHLAGVGIAFYLALGVRSYLRSINYFSTDQAIPNMKNFLDLVALGTIADMVELRGINRVFVKAGFEVISTSPCTGLSALLKESNIESTAITSEDIAFQVAPKINAAGRMDEASRAVQLLIEKDAIKARGLAKKLTALNTKRKEECADCLENTLIKYSIYMDLHEYCVVIKSSYSIGVVGIVASQMAEKLRKPVILITEIIDKEYGKVLRGSCRSANGIDLHAALKDCEEFLLQFGGHKLAAGVTLYESQLEQFVYKLSTYLQNIADVEPDFEKIDLELEVEKVLENSCLQQLQLLEPYGIGNEKPIFLDRHLVINEIKRIGKTGDHLTFLSRGKYENKKCIGFQFGEYEENLRVRQNIDLVYSVSISRFRRMVQWQAQIVDIL